MMTRTLLARCAPLAIAASAALPSIPAFAQDTVTAEPVIVLPEPAPAAPAPVATAPAIVLPDPFAPPIAAEAAPQENTARAAPRTAVPVRTSSIAAAPVARTAPQPAAAASSAPASVVAPIAPAAVEPVQTSPAVASTVDDNTGEIALAALLGTLGLAAVGGVAFAAWRGRRRRALEERYAPVSYDAPAEEIVETPIAEPVPLASTQPEREPVFTAPVAAAVFTAPVVAKPIASAPARSSGDPVALPAELPESFEERDALLKELVAAEPDKANPFISPRARARRAKLIMQSLGRSFRTRKPRIDLSEYTNRWPALRGWQPATA